MNAATILGAIVPHAPTMLEDELDGKPSAVLTALRELGATAKAWGVDVIVAASTHWQTESFLIDNSENHKTVTDYYGFRREIEYDVPGHPFLANMLLQAGQKQLIYPLGKRHGVDHAITIPLHFMFPERDVPVIPISVSGSPLCAFRWGRILGHTLRDWGGKVLFLASGSLAHDLAAFMSGHEQKEYLEFDSQVLRLLTEGNGMELLNISPKLVELAKPEGAFRDVCMLLGVMGSATRGTVRAYEQLPGVGLGVVEFLTSGYTEKDEELMSRAGIPAYH